MNDLEFANLMAREQHARSLGFTCNAYTCADCLAEGKTTGNSTYTDWPDVVDGVAKCSRHAGSRGLAPLTPAQLRVSEAESAVAALTDEERLILFTEYCRACGTPDSSCTCWNYE